MRETSKYFKTVAAVLFAMVCLSQLGNASTFSDEILIKLPGNPIPFIFDLTEEDEAMGFTSIGGSLFGAHGQYCSGACSDTTKTTTFTMTEGDGTTSDTVTVTIRPLADGRDLINVTLSSDVGGNDTSGPGKETATTMDLFSKFPTGFAVVAISDCGSTGKSPSSCSLPVPEPQPWILFASGLLAVGGLLLRKLWV